MNVDEALSHADSIRWRRFVPSYASSVTVPVSDYELTAAALEALAEYVRAHRPPMPHAQRGRTVDHAVELAEYHDGSRALVSLCGGLAPARSADLPDVDTLPSFNPTADDACKTCTRRLPAAIRPPQPTRPPRTRRPDPLERFELWPTVLDGEYAIELHDGADPVGSPPVEVFGSSPTLAEVVIAAREYSAKVSS